MAVTVLLATIEWLDGTEFNWDYTNTTLAHYDSITSNQKCFILDTNTPNHYILADCSLELRELCYLENTSSIPAGEGPLGNRP